MNYLLVHMQFKKSITVIEVMLNKMLYIKAEGFSFNAKNYVRFCCGNPFSIAALRTRHQIDKIMFL